MRRQQVVETVTCDKCGVDTDEPSSWIIEMERPRGHKKPARREIDLCPADAPLVDELHELLRGLPHSSAPTLPIDVETPAGMTACPACGKSVRDNYFTQHLHYKHGAEATQPDPPQCPDCKVPPFGSAPALLSHRRTYHGYDHRAALLASIASPKRKRNR